MGYFLHDRRLWTAWIRQYHWPGKSYYWYFWLYILSFWALKLHQNIQLIQDPFESSSFWSPKFADCDKGVTQTELTGKPESLSKQKLFWKVFQVSVFHYFFRGQRCWYENWVRQRSIQICIWKSFTVWCQRQFDKNGLFWYGQRL